MNTGNIFMYLGDKCKVLMYDKKEVFYGLLTEDNNLEFAKRKTVTYYRTTRDFFDSNSTLKDAAELSENEINIHKPDLPLRLNCFKDIFWTYEIIENLNEFSAFLNSKGICENELEGLRQIKL